MTQETVLDQGNPDYSTVRDPYNLEDEARQTPLHQVGARLLALAQQAVADRKSIEARWLDDLAQYNSVYLDRSGLSGDFGGSAPRKDQPFVGITRTRTNAAISRLQDLLLPTDDANWAIQPTPIPEIDKHAGSATVVGQTPQGAPVQAADIAAGVKRAADEACEQMQSAIADQLEECDYNGQLRDVIRDGCILGAGIIKGPTVTIGRARRWRQHTAEKVTASVLETHAKTVPMAARVDPWHFFPDMSATCLDDCEFVIERHLMPAKKLAALAELPGFNADEIHEAIEIGSTPSNWTATYLNDLRAFGDMAPIRNKPFEVWEYHGPLTQDELLAVGVPVDETPTLAFELEAEVWFVGTHVIKAQLNPMETGERPYSVWCYEEDPACVFGIGVPRQMANSQRGLNAAWRMLADNAGLAVAPQIVVRQSGIRPADGEWSIAPRKVWLATDKTVNINDVFAAVEIPSRISEIQSLFGLAKSLVDDETGLPNIVNPERGEFPQTATGVQMLNTSSMAILRRLVKAFDDHITRPMITRFYDWNMQFNNNEAIKGD